jgi:hypothetical protein
MSHPTDRPFRPWSLWPPRWLRRRRVAARLEGLTAVCPRCERTVPVAEAERPLTDPFWPPSRPVTRYAKHRTAMGRHFPVCPGSGHVVPSPSPALPPPPPPPP